MSGGTVRSETGTLSSMHFWGVCCESGKQYAQVVGQRFRITMAVLDPKSFQNDSSEKIVSLIVLRNGIEYILCVLKHGEIHQVNLNLIFDKGENVKFYIKGHGKVYLSGYQLTDSECDVTNDENGYLCPLVEVKSKKRKSTTDASFSTEIIEPKATTSRGKRIKNEELHWSTLLDAPEYVDDYDEESDEDFEVGEEGTESSAEDNSISSEEPLKEFLSDSSSLEELESPQISKVQKRKQQENTSSKKRSKIDNCNASTSTMENADDIIYIEDNEHDDRITSFNATASTSSTPMIKKEINGSETAFSEKKAKKEKKIKEILQNIKELNKKGIEAESPTVGTSSKQNKHPLVKLEGGVEIQDIFIGNGPVATKGKRLHVFFVGRLPDNQIFDARLPGDKPFHFKLGNKEVIKGWEVAFQGMRVGGRRRIKVPAVMAYGAQGKEAVSPKSPNIPPNATLRFVVDLQNVS